MPTIFISYRRADSATIAGRIYDRLVTIFGPSNVFKDSWSIKPGEDFRDAIRKAVTTVDVLIVVIGPSWLHVTDDHGVRRLDKPDDFVRSEIEAGLQSRDTLVIPVLVNGAFMAPADALPSSIRELAFRNATPVRDDPDFDTDIKKLIEYLRSLDPQPLVTPPVPDPQPRSERNPLVLVAMIGAVATIIAAVIGILPNLLQSSASPTPTPPATTAAAVIASETPALPTHTAVPPSETPAPTNTPNPPTPTSTHTPVPPTDTPTLTATHQPTNTLTWTLTERPTNTTVPPTNTPAASVSAAESLTLTIFRDQDSFTLYVPQSELSYTLIGLIFQANPQMTRQLDRDFSAFQGMPFNNLASLNSALCFRLVVSGTTPSLPLDCSGGPLLLTQQLAAADAFWYDRSTNQDRTVIVLRGSETIGVCAAGQSRCEMLLLGSADTNIPESVQQVSASATPGYPCTATIRASGSSATQLNVVRAEPQQNSRSRSPVRVGDPINLLRSETDGLGNLWYQISSEGGLQLGWIPDQYVTLSNSCPAE